ncbi:hypothetical protein HYDPIDRAFT_31702 [Hydnomerulius pinastri MD-312]|uniref:Uncharacterized protein n=1 Tax=Hydnomerulius pinastri MD-312 TaxID=994086 RepID=A0A0C9UX28_9AGAM|nr:hypothetical protein HYDPIDRAFT_34922 [Hydnomerulius pinastri MD-312]KIJ61004.1 hypothetical protein HYDPIDRAFT_31702 [Hydnomerulius pinastri MD-312]
MFSHSPSFKFSVAHFNDTNLSNAFDFVKNANGDDDTKVAAYKREHPPESPHCGIFLSMIEEIESFALEMAANPPRHADDLNSKWGLKNGKITIKVFIPSTDDIWKLKVLHTMTLSRSTSKVLSDLGFHVAFSELVGHIRILFQDREVA